MRNDQQTLMSAIESLRERYKDDPDCFTSHDLSRLETLTREAHRLLSESCWESMNSERHYQTFDRVHATLGSLEKKYSDYRFQKKWQDAMLRQSKVNPNHKPAGSAIQDPSSTQSCASLGMTGL